MLLGKTKSALQYLLRKADEGVLNLEDHIPPAPTNVCNREKTCTVCEALQVLHPTGTYPSPDSLMSSCCQSSLPMDPIIFEALEG